MDNLNLAIKLSTLGWKVFPCGQDKQPIIKTAHPIGDPLRGKCTGQCGQDGHGYHDATDNFDKLCNWWNLYPGAVVGIACEPSGLLVLDLDRHPGSPDGVATFERLVSENGGGKVITAAAQSTPGDGWHLVFNAPKMPPGFELPATLAPGIDIRYRGYICSGTLADGRAYRWEWLPDGAHAPAYPAPWIAKMILRFHEKAHFENRPKKPRQTKPGVLSPGDDFASRTDWREILPDWALAGGKSDVDYLTRPGKGRGVSASVNYSGKDNLYVFTTSAAPFEAGKSYSKFAAYALLNHSGDFKAAARVLAAKGYGSKQLQK